LEDNISFYYKIVGGKRLAMFWENLHQNWWVQNF